MTLQTILKNLSQEKLLPLILSWQPSDQKKAFEALKMIDPELFLEQRRLVQSRFVKKPQVEFYAPKSVLNIDESKKALGLKLLKEGRVACLLVAGGQGTRLRHDEPKGCYRVTKIRQKSLFQLFAEKLKAASQFAQRPLEMAIMTSPLNHEETQAFFKKNHFFGCDPFQITFFIQDMLPFLNTEGDLLFENVGKLALGPDGNGSAIQDFIKEGIADRWSKKGIDFVNFVLVDNPLADPFDPILVATHQESRVDVTLKCVERIDAAERFGMVVEENNKLKVIEYTEMPDEYWELKTSSGNLVYHIANISLYCFSLNFLKREGLKPLPLHAAFKALNYLDSKGKIIQTKEPSAWKFERFIFDILNHTASTQIVMYPRQLTFAPLKNAHGPYSLESVQKALIQSDQSILGSLTGKAIPDSCVEIDQGFYYPTYATLSKWRTRSIPSDGYIEI